MIEADALGGDSGLGASQVGEHTSHSAEVCWFKAAELGGYLRRARDQRGRTPREAVAPAVIAERINDLKRTTVLLTAELTNLDARPAEAAPIVLTDEELHA